MLKFLRMFPPSKTLLLVNLLTAALVLWVLLFIAATAYDVVGPGYEYHRAVSSHLSNAYELNTPEAMKSEILLAKQGMADLGLESTDYCSLFYWEMTPDCSMTMQYGYLDGLTERVDAVIKWKEQMYSANNTALETLGDVYEQKMDNLRMFITEGGESDWIARDSFYVKNYPLLWIYNRASAICCIAWIPLAFLVFAIRHDLRGLYQ